MRLAVADFISERSRRRSGASRGPKRRAENPPLLVLLEWQVRDARRYGRRARQLQHWRRAAAYYAEASAYAHAASLVLERQPMAERPRWADQAHQLERIADACLARAGREGEPE